MTATPSCTLSGKRYGPNNAALENELVSIAVLDGGPDDRAARQSFVMDWVGRVVLVPQNRSTSVPSVSNSPQNIYTGTDGGWSVTVPQGATIRVRVGASDRVYIVPTAAEAGLDEAGSVDFRIWVG